MTYDELKKLLIQASDAYYKDSNPIMTDYEFDMKLKELESMEAEQGFSDFDSPTKKVGSDLESNDMSNSHKRPMLSLENTYNFDEVKQWYESMIELTGDQNLKVIVNPKWDGNSGAIRYNDGLVYKALTRGSGIVGENITQNVRFCDDNCWSRKRTQLGLPFKGEARGELILTNKGFNILNADGKYQNARNLVSGSLKLLSLVDFAQRADYIEFYAYWLEDSYNPTYAGDLLELKQSGFTVGDYWECKNINEIYDAINEIETKDFGVAIDGAVMKVNDKKYWTQIGSTSKYPRWAKAYKYKQESVETEVKDITFEVGRTGKITPLCWFEPKFVDGTTIQKATLNNKEFMETMDIAISDTIRVQKAAAIIPQIIEVVERPSFRNVIKFPTECPCCKSKLVKHNDDHADWFCDNLNCEAKNVDKIINYTHAIECDGFGEEVVLKLYKNNLLKSIQDLYKLKDKKNDISKLDRLSEKIADKLCNNIEESKKAEFWKVLSGLGIPNVGTKMAKVLAKHYKNIDSLMQATQTDLESVDDIAEITAKGIVNFFNDNKELIESLKSEGVNLVDTSEEKQNDKVKGKVFCITGSLSRPRQDIVKEIETFGGKVSSDVSSKTNYLITNDPKSGSSKNKKAQSLGIAILSEAELNGLLHE